ncbi:hypothetical protein CF70_021680 [Cupriavidus sp. SK-3]|nr:hypothetical protein CF70_021680 [Cupriavidus sp. SK-3]
MKKGRSLYHGHRFPAAALDCAMRWYFRLPLSLRDIDALLFERGVVVCYDDDRNQNPGLSLDGRLPRIGEPRARYAPRQISRP